ncbi:enoyl-ACP reductase FabI [Neptuniibacter caesariensis]|uniref:Enoyl-[acyl-carrier-protein] reductase [NADH] n=1 Tax=Neptuniibacter caesariensis TaxID=207954 RepID=A0A7U8C6X9_NEPCE|nr:enoyl-ACP reductase FabI [Neptuniibacter caesariensis]EAR61220.1 enoyl-(acyl carrier protein) reductase [Oceanospirillum sp. MED92] [Neptuniibacter caesariensis]
MSNKLMADKKVLIVGIANDKSIAYGCAKKLKEQGAELAITYLNEKAERFVRPLADELDASIVMPLDVTVPGQMDAVFAEIEKQWGELDGLIHSLAFCPIDDLHAPISECSREGFLQAMDVSCYSFIEMAAKAKGLMPKGGSLINFSYLGSALATGDYNIMGCAKASLEAATRYLARDLGPKHIRVNCISPGTIATRAAGGIKDFDAMLDYNKQKAVDHQLPTTEEVGGAALYYLSDLSRGVTGTTHYVDHGVCIVG